ncbi:E3 SUMO-protein ligase ZBED1-like [Epargyreus clarus]|uniref:E3 SUMO-protein ligase ZBED1-like n=1 Tax=Epargyreus clarus TaxID=520877 RepID=UPI003C2BBE14
MKRARTSEVWTHFTVESDEKRIAVCKICEQKCSFKTTISNLNQHLKNKHVAVLVSSSSTQLRQISKSDTGSAETQGRNLQNVQPLAVSSVAGISNPGQDSTLTLTSSRQLVQSTINLAVKKMTASQREKIDEQLMLLFIKDFQPFSVVEDRGFKSYSNALNPAYQLPTRQHISNTLLPALYEKCVNRVRTCEIKNITSLPGSHTALNIAEEISRTIDDLGIEIKQILIITTDNAPNMQNAVKQHLGLKHFGCFAHTINLVVEKALEVDTIKSTIEKVKAVVAYYKRSNIAMEKLLKYQIQIGLAQPKRLLQAVPTRWNSVFYMLERFLDLQDALRSTAGLLDRCLPMLSVEEWQICRDLCTILKPLQEVTQQMSGEEYVTGSLIIVFTRVLLTVYENKIPATIHPDVSTSVEVIVGQLKRRLGQIEYSGTFSICSLLDPRYKMHCFNDKSAAEKAKKNLIELVTAEINKKSQSTIRSASPQPSTSTSTSSVSINDSLSIWDNISEMFMDVEPTQYSPQASAITEVQRYLADMLLPIKDDHGKLFDPSDWWRNHQFVYPNLAQLYRNKCCGMSSSVSCERIFSTSGNILTDRRTRLKSEKVKQLMFLNVNM